MKKIICALILSGFGLGAHAVPITGLFNTGVDSAGNALGGAADDPHYSIGASPAKTVDPINGLWYPNSSTYRWIWQQSTGLPGGVAFDFTTSFDLGGLDPLTAAISGLWSTDNQGMDILINGNSSGQSCVGFRSLCSFNISSGFQAGINTLSFRVADFGAPGGLLITDISGTADVLDECRVNQNCEEEPTVPSVNEPGTLGLFALGLLGLAFGRRLKA